MEGKRLAAALEAIAKRNAGRIFGHAAIRRMLQRQKRDLTKHAHTSIAVANRHTGNPHEHRREIERHLRQARRAA